MRYLLFILMVVATSCAAQQNSRTIIGDSIYFKSFDGSSELIIESGSKTTTAGVLTNTGNGRTQFVQLDSSLFDGTDNKIRYDIINEYIEVYVNETWNQLPTTQDTVLTLDSSTIANLHTTPVTVLPAAGANKVYLISYAFARVNFNSVAWEISNVAGVIRLNSGGTVFAQHGRAFEGATSDEIAFFQPTIGNVTLTANKPMTISSSHSIINGDSEGVIKIFYEVVDVN